MEGHELLAVNSATPITVHGGYSEFVTAVAGLEVGQPGNVKPACSTNFTTSTRSYYIPAVSAASTATPKGNRPSKPEQNISDVYVTPFFVDGSSRQHILDKILDTGNLFGGLVECDKATQDLVSFASMLFLPSVCLIQPQPRNITANSISLKTMYNGISRQEFPLLPGQPFVNAKFEQTDNQLTVLGVGHNVHHMPRPTYLRHDWDDKLYVIIEGKYFKFISSRDGDEIIKKMLHQLRTIYDLGVNERQLPAKEMHVQADGSVVIPSESYPANMYLRADSTIARFAAMPTKELPTIRVLVAMANAYFRMTSGKKLTLNTVKMFTDANKCEYN